MRSIDWRFGVELMGITAIVLSLVLVAYELRQNTTVMRAQTRDAMTEKQMMFTDWVPTNRYTAEVITMSGQGKLEPGTPEALSLTRSTTYCDRSMQRCRVTSAKLDPASDPGRLPITSNHRYGRSKHAS